MSFLCLQENITTPVEIFQEKYYITFRIIYRYISKQFLDTVDF